MVTLSTSYPSYLLLTASLLLCDEEQIGIKEYFLLAHSGLENNQRKNIDNRGTSLQDMKNSLTRSCRNMSFLTPPAKAAEYQEHWGETGSTTKEANHVRDGLHWLHQCAHYWNYCGNDQYA